MSQPSSHGASPKPSFWQRLAGGLGFLSLVGAALGFLSAFDNLIATLTRMSLILRFLGRIYEIARDQAWHWIVNACSWIDVTLPDIPDYWKDAAAIVGLIFAALNLESLRLYKRSLILDYLRSVYAHVRKIFYLDADDQSGIFGSNIGLAGDIALVGAVYSLLLVFFVPTIALQFGVSNLLAYAALLAACVVGTALIVLPLHAIYANTTSNLLERAVYGFVFAFSLPAFVIGAPVYALVRGWRAVALALLVVIALLALNYVFLHLVDPLLIDPPPWFTDFINADPRVLQN